MKNLFLSSCLALSLASGLYADSFTVSSVNGGAATGSPKLNLDNLVLGNTTQSIDAVVKVSFTGDAQVVQGFASGLYARPFLSDDNGIGFGNPGNQANGVDTTNYLSTGKGSVVLEFTSQQNYFGLLWGSVDNYNTLEFWNGVNLVGSFTGTQIWASANGDQGEQGTFYVNFTDDTGSFNKVVAKSSQYAFEFDNIAYNGRTTRTVPDGGTTLALLGLAFAGLAAFRRQR